MQRYLVGENHGAATKSCSSATEYILLHHPGECSLHEYLTANNGKLPQKERILFALQISRTLGKMHANGIVHRNLLPSRIYVTKDRYIALIGYENPKALGSSSLTFIRTAYAPPEASFNLNQVSPSFDIYALGMLMFEIWTMTKITSYKLNIQLLESSKAPAPLIALIVKCTDANPQLRCSVHEIVETLEKLYRAS